VFAIQLGRHIALHQGRLCIRPSTGQTHRPSPGQTHRSAPTRCRHWPKKNDQGPYRTSQKIHPGTVKPHGVLRRRRRFYVIIKVKPRPGYGHPIIQDSSLFGVTVNITKNQMFFGHPVRSISFIGSAGAFGKQGGHFFSGGKDKKLIFRYPLGFGQFTDFHMQ